jgi:hypothetical protein
MRSTNTDDSLSEEEIALRMNNAVRRALNTPATPHKKKPVNTKKRAGRKKSPATKPDSGG